MNRLLWVVQALLALLFLFAGAEKQVMSAAELTGQTPFPAAFLRFIGVMEILGAIGLMLPSEAHLETRRRISCRGRAVGIVVREADPILRQSRS